MQKKKFDLTSDIINVGLEEANQDQSLLQTTIAEQESVLKQKVESDKKRVLITIAVDADLRKEYKTWCAKKGIKMNEAFAKAFELLKRSDYI